MQLSTPCVDGAGAVRGTFLNMLGTYGKNLGDEHHGTCWRIAHARQLMETVPTAQRAVAVTDRVPHVPVHRGRPQPLYRA